MSTCFTCGNNYDKCFEININQQSYMFDCFECAIHALAPTCKHCSCRIIGHGVEADSNCYCCAHCASQLGIEELKDRA